MTALSELKSAWTARLASISDPVVKAEATYLLDNYVTATEKQVALEASNIQSYTLGGRSITRRDVAVGQSMIQSMRMDLYRYCYGGNSLVDMNTASETATTG